MIKRRFGMAALNITQGRFKGMTHDNLNAYDLAGMDNGIDRFVTYNELEVIGVAAFVTTGFANTVFFYDAQNDVTIAMSHENKIQSNQFVGGKLYPGDTIYYEGTTGKATGNHIHLEIGRGRQPGKVKINSSEWGLKNWINIEDYYFVDPTYTTVINDFGYHFSPTEVVSMDIKYGLHEYEYCGAKYKVMRADSEKGYGLHLITAPGPNTVKDIMEFDSDKLTILGMVNCSYFEMADYDNYGCHYGVQYDALVGGYSQSISNPRVLSWELNHDDTITIESTDKFSFNKNVKLAVSPYAVRIHNKDSDTVYWSSQYGDKDDYSNSQTFVMKIKDDWCIGVVDRAKPREVKAFGVASKATELFLCDSGGSTQMVSMMSGTREKVTYTGRKIADVLVLARDINFMSEDPIDESNGNLDEEDITGPGKTAVDMRLDALEAKIEDIYKLLEQLRGDHE